MVIRKHPRNNKVILCLAYPNDLEQCYAFYCARYENISYKEFMRLSLKEFMMKISSVPESEPLYKILQSRTINLADIKDKNERTYWRKLKQANKIPDEYLPIEKRKEKEVDFKRLEDIY